MTGEKNFFFSAGIFSGCKNFSGYRDGEGSPNHYPHLNLAGVVIPPNIILTTLIFIMEKKMVWKQGSLRSAGGTIETVDIRDVMQNFGTTGFRLVTDGNGQERLHLTTDDGQYLSVRVGDKVSLEKQGIERIKELVTGFSLYCGVGDNGVWFTFGPEPTTNAGITATIADIFAKNGVAVA